MNELFAQDLNHAIIALEHYIIQEEEDLIRRNAGDYEWNYLLPFKDTLKNLEYMTTIYGRNP